MMERPAFTGDLPSPAGRVDLLMVAGEHSGDEQASRLVRELGARRSGFAASALGGPGLAAAGAQLLHDLTAASVVGVVEVLRSYGYFRDLFAATLRWIETHRPRAVCLVDYPGFNLRLAAALRERGLSVKGGGEIKVLYYISPQIWAWKAGRRFAMARDLDSMAVIFPFEPECYADTGLPVSFVGHPFLAGDYRPPVHYDPEGPILLLPGSRQQAAARIFPVLLDGFRAGGERDAVVLFPSDDILAVLRASEPPANVRFHPVVERRRGTPDATVDRGVGAAAVLTSSGTMSLHCALAGIPGAIAYRANPFTYLLGRLLVRVEYLGIANLLLSEPVYPEYIQGAATPGALAAELHASLHDRKRVARMTEQAARLRARLAVPAHGTATDWLERELNATG